MADGAIEHYRERRNWLRQRQHVGDRNRPGTRFGRGLELEACAQAGQARRHQPLRSVGRVEILRKSASGCSSGDKKDRHQCNKHSIDRLSYTHSPPRKMTPTVPTDATRINPNAVDNLLKSLMLNGPSVDKSLQMLTNIGAGWRKYQLPQVSADRVLCVTVEKTAPCSEASLTGDES
jgi:hypothetical protein